MNDPSCESCDVHIEAAYWSTSKRQSSELEDKMRATVRYSTLGKHQDRGVASEAQSALNINGAIYVKDHLILSKSIERRG